MTSDVEISTDRSRIDRDVVHRWLSQDAYWARGVPRSTLDRAIDHSLAFGVYEAGAMVGFARVVTDRATFAWLCDVYVLLDRRGAGLGARLMQSVARHPDLQGLRRFVLATRDAHGFYERFGFKPLSATAAKGFMEIRHPADELYGTSG
jgi:GNAT superfamily N-acetyltransferase